MWQPGTAPGPAGWRDPFLAIPPGWDQYYLKTQTNRSHAMINHHERLVLDGSQDPQLTRGSGSNQFKFISLPIYCPMLHKWVTQHCLGLLFQCWMEFPNISLLKEDVINLDCSGGKTISALLEPECTFSDKTFVKSNDLTVPSQQNKFFRTFGKISWNFLEGVLAPEGRPRLDWRKKTGRSRKGAKMRGQHSKCLKGEFG